jgi:hypothetical protein
MQPQLEASAALPDAQLDMVRCCQSCNAAAAVLAARGGAVHFTIVLFDSKTHRHDHICFWSIV